MKQMGLKSVLRRKYLTTLRGLIKIATYEK
jgi:hypothetical protein